MATVDLLTGVRVKVAPTHRRMLVLAGPPHTGKSTVGRKLRDRLGFSHVEMSSYAYNLYRAACDGDGYTGSIQQFMDEVVWKDGAFDVIAQDLLTSNHGLSELIVCGPRRPEEIEAFLAADFDVRLLYVYTDSRTRYERYRTANASQSQYALELESFVRRDLTEYSWGLPRIGLMGDCGIVANQEIDGTVDAIADKWVPRYWSAARGA
jgi:dephospho-CoA kinase